MTSSSMKGKHMDEDRRKDLDETRRLLYMAMAAPRTEKYELVGTLVNTLKHHRGSEEPAEVIMDRLIAVVEGTGGDAVVEDALRDTPATAEQPEPGTSRP